MGFNHKGSVYRGFCLPGFRVWFTPIAPPLVVHIPLRTEPDKKKEYLPFRSELYRQHITLYRQQNNQRIKTYITHYDYIGFYMDAELIKIVSQVGAIAVLLIWNWSLRDTLKDYRSQITELNKYAREMDKENLMAINSVVNVMDKLLEDGRKISETTIKEIRDQAEKTQDKIISHIEKMNRE